MMTPPAEFTMVVVPAIAVTPLPLETLRQRSNPPLGTVPALSKIDPVEAADPSVA